MALDQDVVNLAKAIRQIESGNRAVLPQEKGLGGASRYQYTHGTWRSVAGKYLGDPNAPLTLQNENKATYLRIKDWKDQGFNPGQIASMWNAGEGRPNAHKEGMRGVNRFGVRYDVPAYVDKVFAEYKRQKALNSPLPKAEESPLAFKAPVEEETQEEEKDSIFKRIGRFFLPKSAERALGIAKPEEEEPKEDSFTTKAGQFLTETGISIGQNVVGALDFAVDTIIKKGKERLIELQQGQVIPEKFIKGTRAEDVFGVNKEEVARKKKEWEEYFEKNKANLPLDKARTYLEGIREKEAFQPSIEWQQASLSEKISPKYIKETLFELGSDVLGSVVTFLATGATAGATIFGAAAANDVKNLAEEYGVEPDKATKLGALTGVGISVLERAVPAKILGAQKKKFLGGFFKRMVSKAKSAGISGMQEATTESLQEAIQLAAEQTFRDDLGWDEAKTRTAMSALGGFLGGTGMQTFVNLINNKSAGEVFKDAEKTPFLDPKGDPRGDINRADTLPTTEEILPTEEVITVEKKPRVSPGLEEKIEELGTAKVEEDATVPTEEAVIAPEEKALKEKTVIHGTQPENIQKIKDTGFNKTVRSRIGEGVYFTDSATTQKIHGDSGIKVNMSDYNLQVVNPADLLRESTEGETLVDTFVRQTGDQFDGFIIPNKDEKVGNTYVIINADKLNQQEFGKIKRIPIRVKKIVKPTPTKAPIKKKVIKRPTVRLGVGLKKKVEVKPKKKLKEVIKKKPIKKEAPKKVVVKPKEVKVPRVQLPVSGTGKKKVSRLEARVKEALGRVNKEKQEELGISTFTSLNKKENIRKASQYVVEKPKEALEVLKGNIDAPPGILRNSIMVAMQKLGDTDSDLALKLSSLLSTRAGQELSVLTELDEFSPTKIMSDIVNIKEAKFEQQRKGVTKKETTNNMKKKVKRDVEKRVKKARTKKTFLSLVDELKCK